MKDRISALQDGELDPAEAGPLIARIKAAPALRRAWDEYHFVGDALRGHVARDLCDSVKARLDAEPTVIAPRRMPRAPVASRWASAAAGLAAVAAVTWIAFSEGPAVQVAQAPAPQPPAAVLPPAPTESSLAKLGVGNYLLAHQRYSPANAMQGVAPYVRAVSSGGEQR